MRRRCWTRCSRSTGCRRPTGELLEAAAWDDAAWWAREYGVERDRSGLVYEENVLRYRVRPGLRLRVPEGAPATAQRDAVRCLLASARCGARVRVSVAEPPGPLLLAALSGREVTVEDDDAFAAALGRGGPGRVRVVGPVPETVRRAANDAEVDVADAPVTASGRLEPLWYLREQAISRTRHRFGNLTGAEA